jgi:hypothetical protein
MNEKRGPFDGPIRILQEFVDGKRGWCGIYPESCAKAICVLEGWPKRKPLIEAAGKRPKVVCLCGSTRFPEAFQRASLEETLGGKIVLSIGCNLRDDKAFDTFTQEHKREIKLQLDELHKRKIDLADEVFILNVGGYVGESMRSEIKYAIEHGKPVRWLEPESADATLRSLESLPGKEEK